MANFMDAIDSAKKLDDIKDVPPVPVGTYLLMVSGHPEKIKAQTGTEGLSFKMKFLQPRDDVDPQSLKLFLEATEKGLSEFEMPNTIYDSPYAEQNLRDFLKALGIPGNKGLKQAIAEAPGAQCLGHIRHRPSQDGSRLMANFDRFAKAS